PSGQEKLAVPGDHRAATILLPGDHPDVRDAPAELEDLRARTCGRRARRAEVVDAERDRLRDTVAAALLEQVKQGRELEEAADDAAVHRGQGGIGGDLLPGRGDALEG